MPALVRDLQIIERADGFWFEFTWEGRGDEWRRALDAVKKRIPPEAREYDPDAQLWRVVEAFEDELADIFPNFAGALDAIRSQLSLLGEESVG
jgi:hypothetical protein